MSVTLGVDMGSHGARAVAISNGAVVAAAAATYAAPPPARRDAEELWRVLVECLGALPADLRCEISALGVTGVRGAVVGLGETGAPVTPVYPDFDDEAVMTTRSLTERIGATFLADTGCPLFPLAGLPKMLLPIRGSVRWWLGAQDYIGFRLSSRIALSAGSALRLGVLDRLGASINRVVLANAGVAAEKIPSLVQIGDAVGYLTSAAASEVGLRKGIPIVACPGDVPAAFIAVGAQPDVVFANLGTTTVVCCLVAHPAAREGFTHEILDRGRRSLETGFGGGGVTFDWLSRLFGMTQEILEHEAEAAAPSSVKVEPELLSPWGAQPRGLIGDIGVTDGRSEIVQAAYRSVALRVIELASALEAIAGPKDRLLLGGGGASSDLLSHEIGRLWKGSLQRFSERELAAEGAAMTASIALAQAPIVRHVAQ